MVTQKRAKYYGACDARQKPAGGRLTCVTEILRHGAPGHCPFCLEELGGLEPFLVLFGSAQHPSYPLQWLEFEL